MFDIGFSELIIVFVVGLLILGPERLPHAARTAGLWVRKIRRSINSVQREINAQLDQEELQQKINETNQRILNEGQNIQNTMTPLSKSNVQEPVVETTDDQVIKENTPVNLDADIMANEEAPVLAADQTESNVTPVNNLKETTPETIASRS